MLARDFASRRRAFGKLLIDHPLHAETLDGLDARLHAAFHLTFHVVELLGREECELASEAELAILRLLTPVAKLYTAKEAVAVASEAMEAFGGAGYVEDTGIPRLLRDAQVLPIWEGTTNVLSLDVWRAIERTDALAPWVDDVTAEMARVRQAASSDATLAGAASQVLAAVQRIASYARTTTDAVEREIGARRFAFAIARTDAASRLVAHAAFAGGMSSDRGASLRSAVRLVAHGLTRGIGGHA